MSIDWLVVATIAGPIIGGAIGVWLTLRFEKRPVLISYYGHISGFAYTPPAGGAPLQINSHTVFVRNTGGKAATNVRLHHLGVLPSFDIWPQVPHRVDTLPNGSQDIVIPTLIPRQEVRVAYIYAPPRTVSQVNAGIQSDQGFATQIPVLLQRRWPKWWNATATIFFLIGVIAFAYVAYAVVKRWIG